VYDYRNNKTVNMVTRCLKTNNMEKFWTTGWQYDFMKGLNTVIRRHADMVQTRVYIFNFMPSTPWRWEVVRSSETPVSYLNTCTISQPRRPRLESSPPWKPKIISQQCQRKNKREESQKLQSSERSHDTELWIINVIKTSAEKYWEQQTQML
jgi:hypothetical protein